MAVTQQLKYRLKFMFQKVDIYAQDFVIGRGLDCNLVLEDPLVSRRHARISTAAQVPTIDDLGSRNGTLVNNVPVFSAHPLAHNDRLRIGSQEILFVIDNPALSRSLRNTGAMVSCHACKVPMPRGLSRCPHCDVTLLPQKTCARCGKAMPASEQHCRHCRARQRTSDPTIPISFGNDDVHWSEHMIAELIREAIAQGRFSHATRVLLGKMEDFDLRWASGLRDMAALLRLSQYNATLAAELDDATKVAWVLSGWQRAQRPVPPDLFRDLLKCRSAAAMLSQYLQGLKRDASASETLAALEQIWAAQSSQRAGA
ncbi:MAG: FHA domain-containing protein [Myxococcales bacterium]|jgi:hypothetical protein|nr:FHA domain-containing protein [Myxococcales bacterium]